MILTLGYAKEKLAKWIRSGTCDPQAQADVINEAIELLLCRAHWKDTVRTLRFCDCDGCITLPRFVDRILQASIDAEPARVWSIHYRFIEGGPGRIDDNSDWVQADLADLGDGHSTFSDPPKDVVVHLCAFSTEASDVGKVVHVEGFTTYTVPAYTNGVPGVSLQVQQYLSGIEGVLPQSNAITKTDEPFSTVHSVLKPATKGYVTLYAFAPSTGHFYHLAKYYPDETRPAYRRYRVLGRNSASGNSIVALCSLRFVPVINDNDVLLVNHMGALKSAVMAVSAYEDKNPNLGGTFEARALALISAQRKKDYPTENEMSIQMDEFAPGAVQNVI